MFTRGAHGVIPDDARSMTFPAGERHVVPDEDPQGPLAVLVRGAGAEDLVSAAMAIDAARRAGRPTALVLPYLAGAQQDRGRPFGAEVYARLINAVRADRVLAVDPHSPVMPGLIENLVVHPLTRLVRAALTRRVADARTAPYVGVIAPDAGAVDRAGAVAVALGLPLHWGTTAWSRPACPPPSTR